MKKRVAIIGLSFRFPSTNTDQYWSDLLDGRDLVTEVEASRWAKEGYLHPDKNHPGSSYTFAAGSVGDVSLFDAGFFGISPREAAMMDPQQRLLLEMSWEALENAGIKPSKLRGSDCGVFIGIASTDYANRLSDDISSIDSSVATGNTNSVAANRISYVLDLHGPSMAIDTACSSSMVAFHQACRSILSGETTHALAGGVSLHLHPYGFIIFSKATMLSKRGRCNVFDAAGDGYVRSEGGGIFVLKDYDQAMADGDQILAVVANSAVNTDGRKTGLTVPSPKVQSALLQQVYSQAGIDPADVDYLEAHGTGTAVGDPIEARAIGDALGKRRPKDKPLLIGSVKSNMGHLEAASGIAGLVKAVHCIQHRVVPGTIGIKTLNPKIEFDDWNIEVASETRALKPSGKLIVGINSFGFGGANAHVILESHEPNPIAPQAAAENAPATFIVSGKDSAALKAAAREFATFVQDQPATALYDIAYGAAFRRERHEHSAVVEGTSAAAVAQALREFADDAATSTQVETGTALANAQGPVFIYSGNGSQWAGMGKRLLEESPVFKAAVQQVDAIFQRHSPDSLEAELAGRNGEGRYDFTEVAQPALFALQVGVTQMLRQRGMEPVAVAGHSVGEVAAAWASGALTLEDAVEVIFQRSRLQGTTKGKGEMTAVGLGHAAAESILTELALTPGLVIAGMNSSRGVTIAGDPARLTQLETVLTERGVFNRRLALDYAFHSPAMDEIEAGVRATLAGLQPVAARVPFYSTVTGALLDGTALGAEYWWHNIRQPVLFEQAMQQILATGANVFIEVGPHAVLRSYINDCLKDQSAEGRVIATLARGDDAAQRVWGASAQALISGVDIDWQQLFPTTGNFVQLPYYPWQRERHWHPVTAQSLGQLERRKVHPLLGYALQQQALTWENQLDTRLNPMLADHVVGDTIIFPGAGFGELALAAALEWQPGTLAEVEELEIRAPLLLSESSAKIVRVAIDPQDGSLTVKAREVGSTDPWTVHTVGRILREPRDGLLRQDAPVLPTRQPDFSGASHAALTEAVGLKYGPAFQCIDFGWVENGSALAVLKMPQGIEAELAQMHMHPAVLDCTYQLTVQLLKDSMGMHEDLTFIPTKMGRISLRASQAQPGFARATLLRRTAHSLTAEFTVFDTEGVVIATVKEARFRSVRLSKSAADRLRFLDYHGIPQPHPLASGAAPAMAFDNVHSALAELARRSALTGSLRRYCEEVDPLLDSLCSRYTREALQRLSADGRTLPEQQVLALQSAHPEIAPFLAHLLLLAGDDQAIVQTDAGWELVPGEDDQASAEDIWNSLVADYPDYFQIVHSVGRIGMHLSELLDGSLTLDKVCPRETSLVTLLRQALGARSKQRIGHTLQELIAQGLRELPDGQRLRIVEVSEGEPAFAMDACLGLDADRADYAFATTSSATLEEVARLQEQFPHIDARLIGAAAAPVAGCHLAIVTLDFGTVAEAVAALEYARSCLAPGGSLVVAGQHGARWIDFVFGAQRQHWSLLDNGNWLSSQRTVQFWQQQLQQLGFAGADLFELSPDTLSGPYLLLAQQAMPAQQPATAAKRAPRSWILLADETGVSAQLSDQLVKQLQERGDMVVQAGPGDTAAIEALLRTTTASYGKLDGIVHLAGIASPVADAEAVLEQQVARCALAAAIVQACESTSTKTTCWLVTHAGASDMLPHATATPVLDAALWGFGRTLINEASDCAVRLVDIESTLVLESIVTALAQELEQPDAEQEVILTRTGARYVPRLRLEERPEVRQEIDSPTISLAFQYPGQLRNLRWEAHPRAVLGQGEIEVDVRATGLNFRDVMYALGLLSDEAIENGFSGPTLGLEFSGVVTAVADPDCGYAPGDLVVGFGPSSFGNRVVTQASAISLIPPEISLEAAATIPSTFFTVYYAMHHLARMQPGEKVLIHGAAGGVGIAAIQVAKWIGAEIYATAGSDEKRDFLRQQGIEHIYDSRSLAFADEILAQTGGKGVDVVLNSLAGEAINRNFRVLKPFGRFLELGKRDFYENTKIGLRPFRNNISYFGIDADQLMQSRPELTRSLFAEMMSLFTEGVLHPLPYHVFDANDIVEAFRYMQQARQIGKIVVTYNNDIAQIHTPAPAAATPLALAADGSYLVTGGLGGFGLRTAEWLAAKGARHLVLISRSGPSAGAAKEAIARLEAQGVTVHAAACDITDRQALAALLAETGKTMPALKGIVHAATVINDGLIRNMDAAQIRSVLAPKAMGAQNLHELTLGTALDFFVMFSSATTLFGNPGQGNYVAANACLEALAKYRRANGLAATCVRWGAIDDVGFLARNEKIKDALQGRMGGSALNSSIALDALESLLTSGQSGLGVMELDWKALARFLPSAGSPKFSELARDAMDSDGDEEDSGDIQRVLAELSDAELQTTLIDMIKSEVGEILRVSTDKIDPNRSIYDMGLDSLMGVELVVALEGRFGIQLSVMALSQSPTITKLAERIGLQLRGSDEAAGTPDESQVLAQTRQLMAQHGSGFTAETIASMAQDIESQGTAARMIQ